jgi:AcrR family transcriptional regulator
MARPKRADAEETRKRVLQSALAMFAEHGFDGVSIRKIAGGAGVTLATVHHYFGSKDDLYQACIETMYAQMVELQPRLIEAVSAGGEEGAIDRIVRQAFRFARDHQVQMRLLMRQVMGAGELDPDRRERLQVPFLDRVSEIVGGLSGRPAGEVRLSLQTITFVIARYAISSERELELFTGRTGDAGAAAIEDHLVRVANAMFARE